MATKTSRDEFWHIPDELWNLLEPVLGPDKAPCTPGRPARPSRPIFEAILYYVLRAGCYWHALPRKEFAPPRPSIPASASGSRPASSIAHSRLHSTSTRRSAASAGNGRRSTRRRPRPHSAARNRAKALWIGANSAPSAAR